VRSPLRNVADAPRQGDEGAPDAVLELDPSVEPALAGLEAGSAIVVLTWLHLADRSTLAVHPRGDLTRRLTGVFATRAPDRPNPVGLHEVPVLGVDGPQVTVSGLEAVDGTPILDIKPVLAVVQDR
jgi:tRNA-Thr(GGU) m(6)t(6)A37 methyltransferase TsaA